MSIHVAIHDGPLGAAEPWPVRGAGAVLCFEGVVRPLEDAQPIAGLTYDIYDPMAEQELSRLAGQAMEQFGLLAVHVEHSRGFVANFACSFRLRIASAHRKEALAAMDWFIDRMKQQAPIWKRSVTLEQATEATP